MLSADAVWPMFDTSLCAFDLGCKGERCCCLCCTLTYSLKSGFAPAGLTKHKLITASDARDKNCGAFAVPKAVQVTPISRRRL